MAPPVKRKRCCIPYCKNVQELSRKQFFKIGANLEGRDKFLSSIGKTTSAKWQVLFCCEDHFDLPNDAENYIRFKYVPGTKLKLRPNVLPQKKLPSNVCRLCLKLIHHGDEFVNISGKDGSKNAQVIAATLPEVDLSITVEPVACVKCFGPLEQYYRIKQNTLNSEVVVVNCIKTIVKRSPTRLIKNCEIDLFEEYNDIIELLEKEKERSETSQDETVIQNQSDIDVDKQDLDKTTEEIVIQIESNEPDGKFVAENTKGSNHESVNNCMQNIIEERSAYKVLATSQTGQGTLAIIENMHYTPDSEKKYETVFISSEKS